MDGGQSKTSMPTPASYQGEGYEVDVPEPSPAPAPAPAPAPEPVSPEPAAPAPAPAPSPAPEAKPAVEPAPADPAAPAPVVDPANPPQDPPLPPVDGQLFELPDGRKVTAEQMRTEYLHLLPEFTRRSQELAALKNGGDPNITKPPEEVVPEWKKEGYQAKSVAELVEIAAAEAAATLRGEEKAKADAETALASRVDSEIAAVKAIDPNVNENLLFQHANKYGFTDLTRAYVNMTEMNKIRVETEKMVTQNLKMREADPVAAAPSEPTVTEELDPNETRNFSSALDYLHRNKPKP